MHFIIVAKKNPLFTSHPPPPTDFQALHQEHSLGGGTALCVACESNPALQGITTHTKTLL